MARFLIVNTDNFGGDYPDEKFVENLPIFTDRGDAEDVVAAIHAVMPNDAPRFFKVVEEGYKLHCEGLPMTAPRRNNAKITLRMQTALKANGHTYDDLVLVSGLAKESVARWVKQMRELGVVRVCAWNDDVRGRRIVPVFQWGTEPDLPRPGRRWTAAETMARMRERRRAESSMVSLEDTL